MLSGAVALAGIFGISSCSSSDDVASETNPNYNPTTNEVTTDFVFSVSTGNTPATRMNAANTQATIAAEFRGIEETNLMPFKLGAAKDGKYVATPTVASKSYDLGQIIPKGGIDPDATDNASAKSHRVVELAVPVETNVLMFWGKAIKDSGEGMDAKQGKIEWTVDKDLSQTSFKLCRRVLDDETNKGQAAYGQYQTLMAAVLTRIVQSTCEYDATYGDVNKKGTLKWSDYTEIVDGKLKGKTEDPADETYAMCPLGEVLRETYVTLNTIYPNELRAGSGPAIARLMGDLYAKIHKVVLATPTTLQETIAQEVAQTVEGNIKDFFTNLENSSETQWNTANIVKQKLGGGIGTETPLVTDDLNKFPTSFGVPAGAAVLEFDLTNREYSYKVEVPTYAMGGGSSFNIFNYMYPAELCYFGNSPLRASDTPHIPGDYPDGVINWENDAKWNSDEWTKNTHVLSSTRSVAMQNNINYGTALLKTTVRYGAAELQDNNATIQSTRIGATEANHIINVGGEYGQQAFQLTGVLVGGQTLEMGWNYVAKAEEPLFNLMVYDSDVSFYVPAYDTEAGEGAKSSPNYTLLWDNWNPALIGSHQNDVYIALEFKNNSGKDFWGENSLIANGGTFYIVGKIDPDTKPASVTDKTDEQYAADKSLGITWPTNYALPPYDATTGNTIQQRRVFIQDYMTEANFVIGATSLQHALIGDPEAKLGDGNIIGPFCGR